MGHFTTFVYTMLDLLGRPGPADPLRGLTQTNCFPGTGHVHPQMDETPVTLYIYAYIRQIRAREIESASCQVLLVLPIWC
jgi:hypothetical protein